MEDSVKEEYQHKCEEYRNQRLDRLRQETAIIAYLDLTNMFHWQNTLGWRFRIEDVIHQILEMFNVKEAKVYYGKNMRDEENSEAFHKRIRKTGAILKTKPVKYIKKSLNEASFFKRSTMTLFDGEIKSGISQLIESIQQSGIVIEEPKCNFDVEIALDMIDDMEKVSAVIVYSGDSDLAAPLERLKIKGKRIYIVGVRGMTATELHALKDMYIDFGLFYQGKKMYL